MMLNKVFFVSESKFSISCNLSQLVKYGYLKIIGGNKHKTGYEYEIVNKKEYMALQGKLINALDAALDKIKKAA